MAVLNGWGKSRSPTGIRSPDRPARSQSLYRLRYPGPHPKSNHYKTLKIYRKLHISNSNDLYVYGKAIFCVYISCKAETCC